MRGPARSCPSHRGSRRLSLLANSAPICPFGLKEVVICAPPSLLGADNQRRPSRAAPRPATMLNDRPAQDAESSPPHPRYAKSAKTCCTSRPPGEPSEVAGSGLDLWPVQVTQLLRVQADAASSP